MKNNTRKIVVLDRINSPRIEQAIFILRDTRDTNESAAVTEAQRIVNSYLDTLAEPCMQPKRKKKIHPAFFVAVALYTVLTATLTAYLLSLIK